MRINAKETTIPLALRSTFRNLLKTTDLYSHKGKQKFQTPVKKRTERFIQPFHVELPQNSPQNVSEKTLHEELHQRLPSQEKNSLTNKVPSDKGPSAAARPKARLVDVSVSVDFRNLEIFIPHVKNAYQRAYLLNTSTIAYTPTEYLTRARSFFG